MKKSADQSLLPLRSSEEKCYSRRRRGEAQRRAFKAE